MSGVVPTLDELDASYEAQLFMLQTSGCSCPSPQETWSVEAGPCATLQELRDALGKDMDPGAKAALDDAEETLANEKAAGQ
jgi:hypothetical protein